MPIRDPDEDLEPLTVQIRRRQRRKLEALKASEGRPISLGEVVRYVLDAGLAALDRPNGPANRKGSR